MIWPSQFANTSLLYALHDRCRSDPSETDGWQISRYRFFLYVAAGSFVWYWYVGHFYKRSQMDAAADSLVGCQEFCGKGSRFSASLLVSIRCYAAAG